MLADVSSEALPVLLFGASWAGIPFVPLNYRLPDGELRTLAGRVSPALAVAQPGTTERLDGLDGIGVVDRGDLWQGLVGDPHDRERLGVRGRGRGRAAVHQRHDRGTPRRLSCANATWSPTSSDPSTSARPARRKRPW